MKIRMAAILIGRAFPAFRFIVSIKFLRRAEDGCAGIKQQMDVAFEPDASAQIGANRKADRSSAGLGTSVDRLVDGRAVEGFSVAYRAERTHVAGFLAPARTP